MWKACQIAHTKEKGEATHICRGFKLTSKDHGTAEKEFLFYKDTLLEEFRWLQQQRNHPALVKC